MGGVRRVVPLTLGWCDVPYSLSVLGAPDDVRLREPVPALLLDCDGAWVLLDTGLNPALVRDPETGRRIHAGVDFTLPVDDGFGEPLLVALERVGLGLTDIAAVAVSHLHSDHAGGLRLFAGTGIPVHIQRAELDYGLRGPAAEVRGNGIIRSDFDDPAIDWRVVDGDDQIAPGLTALPTAGHTPGHQSFLVDLDARVAGGAEPAGYVFAFDAADLTENIEREVAVGGAIGVPAAATLEPLLRLKALAAERYYPLVPGHDPRAWPTLTTELGAPLAPDPLA